MGYSTDIFASGPSEGFICAICHDVLKDAFSLNCGHTFCGGCIDALPWDPSCPNCRVSVTSSNPNYAMRDVIGELAVKCPDSILTAMGIRACSKLSYVRWRDVTILATGKIWGNILQTRMSSSNTWNCNI